MYHVELRQFPRSAWRFNLSGAEVGAILRLWVLERAVEMGGHRWSPHQATLTVIEGPEIEVPRLSMGRGWRAAQREGRDVTEQVLGEARREFLPEQDVPAADPARAVGEPSASGAREDPVALAMRIGSLLGPRAQPLLETWSAVASRSPGLAPSESLALAERELADGPEPPPAR